MALMTISRAISTGITNNVAIAELKHKAKLADIKLQLGVASKLRVQEHNEKLTNAQTAHSMWHAGLSPAQVQLYNSNKEFLEAIIAEDSTAT
jgi:hypothetical protein